MSVDTCNAASVKVGFCCRVLKSIGDMNGEKLRTTGSWMCLLESEPPAPPQPTSMPNVARSASATTVRFVVVIFKSPN